METTTPQENAPREVLAAVARTFGAPLVLEPVVVPAPPAGAVRVRLTALSICGSDLTFLSGAWGGALPALYGHEAAGIVEAVGAGVQTFTPGMRVAAGLLRWCGSCPSCADSRVTACQTTLPPNPEATIYDTHGQAVWQAMAIGAFAEAIVVHESQLTPLPDGLSDEAGALLSCGGITGFGSVHNVAQVQAGESVVVLGAGGVGLNCIQAAAVSGAGCVLALDKTAKREATAKACGADTFILVGDDLDATAQEVRQALNTDGADHVLLAVGVAALVPFALSLLRPGGTLTLVGMPAGAPLASFDMTALADSGKRILGSKMGKPAPKRDFPRLYQLVEEGKMQIAPLIAQRRPFTEINDAIAEAQSGSLRQVLTFS